MLQPGRGEREDTAFIKLSKNEKAKKWETFLLLNIKINGTR
jgi:hypothetical protein